MSPSQTARLQCLLDRLRQGDEAAGRELVGLAYERLRLLARRILRRQFPRFGGRHGTDSVLNATAVQLLRSLHQVRPKTCRDFFNFAAIQIRRVLLNIARRERDAAWDGLPEEGDGQGGSAEPAGSTDDPVELAEWAEFHDKVGQLPDAEREVVQLHWFLGLTQAKAAEVMGIEPRMVSHHWVRARLKLADWVPGFACPPRDRGDDHGA
jgi:RNA polymerase sigma factor (sigma-70 family)